MGEENGVIELGKKVAALEKDVFNLNGWQKNQNGALLRVDAKVDGLKNWMLGIMGTSLLSLLLLAFNLLGRK